MESSGPINSYIEFVTNYSNNVFRECNEFSKYQRHQIFLGCIASESGFEVCVVAVVEQPVKVTTYQDKKIRIR